VGEAVGVLQFITEAAKARREIYLGRLADVSFAAGFFGKKNYPC
jgi:hypothetical protein